MHFFLLVVIGSESEVAEEMECEMQARDFFVHIGMLILEGRTPEHSDKGRIEGPHCLPMLSVEHQHVCNPQRDFHVSVLTMDHFTVL